VSRDGKTFFVVSNPPGSQGLDIWVSRGASTDQPWGEPVNMGEPVSLAFNDFCPTASRDSDEFYFVSNRPGGCGGDDIYATRFRGNGTIDPPVNLGDNVNSAAAETRPSLSWDGTTLYFGSTRSTGKANIYVSVRDRLTRLGP